TDISAFVSQEVIDGCVARGVFELPPAADVSYLGFVDPSGGASDAMALAIAHRVGDTVVLDAARETTLEPTSRPADTWPTTAPGRRWERIPPASGEKPLHGTTNNS